MENKNKSLSSAFSVSAILFFLIIFGTTVYADKGKFTELDGIELVSGYLSRLLINENPFPGERGYKSVEDSKLGMVQILWVLNSRIHKIPTGYRQEHVANIKSVDVIDIITAQGQCDGFDRNEEGRAVVAERVEKRLKYLMSIANKGDKPGKFAELINYAQGLSRAYVKGGIEQSDRFAGLEVIKKITVTGHAYSWMTDKDYYRPGGDFIFIPDSLDGSIGGNRFYTLKKRVYDK